MTEASINYESTPPGIMKNSNFRRLWAGHAVSLLGDHFYTIALPLLALQLSGGSGLALGTALMLASIPRALLMLIGGAFSDRFSPRTIIIGTNFLNAISIGLLALLIFSGQIQLWHLYVISFSLGFVDAFYFPASAALLPRLVEKSNLESGNSIMQITQRGMLLIGPALAGIFIALFGIPLALLLDVVTFFIANIALFFIREGDKGKVKNEEKAKNDEEKPGLLASIREGLAYVRKDAALLGVMILVAAVDFAFSGSLGVGLPVLAERRYPEGAAAFGIMLSAFGAGALLGIVLGGVWKIKRLGYLFLAMMLGFSVSLGGMAFAPTTAAAALLTSLAGLCSGLFNVKAVSWLQRRTDEALLGRVMSLVMLSSVGLAPLSNAIAGGMVDFSMEALFIGAALLVFVVMIVMSFRKSFREITI